jgi:asparagine synthetase B (glutamine-hydrolysing)
MKGTGSRAESSWSTSSKRRGIALFSGGLDSILAARVAKELGIDVLALHIQHLFDAERGKGERLAAGAAAAGVPLRVIDLSEEHLEVVRRPVHGYGRGMNPCLDCRVFMLRAASRVMEEEGAEIVLSGEVVGQRPMSQHLRAMALVAEESGLGERLFRPLSAALLPDTLPVKRGWFPRERQLALRGRGRQGQVALAASFGITSYPQPAGGCLLLEKVYAARLRDAFAHLGRDRMGIPEFLLLKHGRQFRLSEEVKVIVGRNEGENNALDAFRAGRVSIEPVTAMGPLTLVEGRPSPEEVLTAASLAARYADRTGDEPVEMAITDAAGARTVGVRPFAKDDPRLDASRIEPRR